MSGPNLSKQRTETWFSRLQPETKYSNYRNSTQGKSKNVLQQNQKPQTGNPREERREGVDCVSLLCIWLTFLWMMWTKCKHHCRKHTHIHTCTDGVHPWWIIPSTAKMFSLKWHLKFHSFQPDVWKSHRAATETPRADDKDSARAKRSPPDVHEVEVTAVSTATKEKHSSSRRSFTRTYHDSCTDGCISRGRNNCLLNIACCIKTSKNVVLMTNSVQLHVRPAGVWEWQVQDVIME